MYSNYSKRFLKGDINHGYITYTLALEGESKKIKAHRLVAMLFIGEAPEGKNIVNHIDGDKLNNHFTNLEWCDVFHNNKHARDTGLNNISQHNSERWEDPDFRKRTSENISKGLIESGVFKGKNNPKFRYLITQNEIELSRQELANLIGKAISTTDQWIKKHCDGQKYKPFVENNIIIVDTKK